LAINANIRPNSSHFIQGARGVPDTGMWKPYPMTRLLGIAITYAAWAYWLRSLTAPFP
jgi:hypothetical protein